jgi:hypothetical protein
MIQWVAIGGVALALFGAITGSAPRAIELVPGQVYRTGSPLSQPGPIGLVGGMAGMLTGGGYEVWQGPHVGVHDEVINVGGVWVPTDSATVAAQAATYTQAQAQAAQDGVDWSTVPNQPRSVVPNCAGQRLYVTYAPDSIVGAVAKYECK